MNVKIQNKGIDWNSDKNLYWKHDVERFEALKVTLHGNAEFEAVDVNIEVRQLLFSSHRYPDFVKKLIHIFMIKCLSFFSLM